MTTYYQLLGVAKSASQDDIKTAYRRLIAKHHPDKGGYDDEQAQRINHAYETLKDPKKRHAYDQQLAKHELGERVWRFFDKAQSQFQHAQSQFSQNFKDNVEFLKSLKNSPQADSQAFDEYLKVAVYPWQAVFGDKVAVRTAFHHLLVPMPAFAETTHLVIKGAGKPKGDGGFGNLNIEFVIKVPNKADLSDKQKELWQRLQALQKP